MNNTDVKFEDDNVLIYLVPGAWHHPDCYNSLCKYLPYPSVVHYHETTGAVPADKTVHDDGRCLRDGVTKHVEAGKKVLVYLHSYGGTASAVAFTDETLSYSYRQRNGLPGGIIMLLYVSSLIVPKGHSAISAAALIKTQNPGKYFPDISGTYMLFKGDAIDAFYNDVEDKEEALYWARRLQHGCLGQFSEKVDVEPWSFYPAIYVLTEYDNAGTREKQEELIEMMGDGCRKVIRMNTGHSPFLSKPKEMADVVKEAVKDGEEWSGVASAL